MDGHSMGKVVVVHPLHILDVQVGQSSMPEGEIKRAGGDKGGSLSRWLDSTIQVSTFGDGREGSSEEELPTLSEEQGCAVDGDLEGLHGSEPEN